MRCFAGTPNGSAVSSYCRLRLQHERSVRAYRNLQEEAEQLARKINARHGYEGYLPILLIVQHYESADVFELLRAAVSSLHDGMNLAAKGFVAARDDEQGVLTCPILPAHRANCRKR